MVIARLRAGDDSLPGSLMRRARSRRSPRGGRGDWIDYRAERRQGRSRKGRTASYESGRGPTASFAAD